MKTAIYIYILLITAASFSQHLPKTVTFEYTPVVGVSGYVETVYEFKPTQQGTKWRVVSSVYVFQNGAFRKNSRIDVDMIPSAKPIGKRASMKAYSEITALIKENGDKITEVIDSGENDDWQ